MDRWPDIPPPPDPNVIFEQFRLDLPPTPGLINPGEQLSNNATDLGQNKNQQAKQQGQFMSQNWQQQDFTTGSGYQYPQERSTFQQMQHFGPPTNFNNAGVPSQYHTFTDDPVDSSRVNVDNENVAEKSDGNQWYDPLQASGDDMSISDYSDQEREDHTTMPTVIDYQHGKVSIVPEYGSEICMGPQFQKDVHKAKIVDQHGQADNDIEYEADMNNPLHFQKEEHEPKTVEDFYTKAKMLLPLGKDHQAETKSNKQLQKVKQTDNESPEKTNELKLVTENVIKELAASVNLLSKLQEAKKVHVPEVEKVTCTDKSAGEWTKEKDKPREVKKEVVEKQHAVTEVHSEITDDSDGDPEHVQAQIFLGNLAPSTTLEEIQQPDNFLPWSISELETLQGQGQEDTTPSGAKGTSEVAGCSEPTRSKEKETIPSLYQDLVIIGRQHGQEQLEIECAHYVARNVPKGETINVVQCDKKLPAEDAVDLDLESIQYVTEVLKRKKGETIYVCGLCHCVNFNAHIFGHVTGYKHRMKFFEVCKPEVHKIIKDANLTGLKELKSVCLRAAQAIEESDGLSQVLTITEAQKILLEARYGPMIQYRPPKSKQTEVLVVAPKLEGKRGPSTPGPFPVVSLETDIFKMKVTGEMLQKLGLIQAAQPVEYKESLDQDVHLYKYLQENSLMDSPLPGSTPSTRKEEANKTVAMVDEPIRPRVFDIIRRNSSLHLMTEYQNAVNQAEKPRFDCRLCNVKLTCDSVYSHLIGDRHVTTYMEKHHNILSDAVKERPERLDMYGRWLDASGPRKVTVVQISGYNARQEPLYTYPKHIEDTEYVSPYAGMYTLKYIETTTDAINSIQPKPRKNSGTDGKQLTQAISKDQGLAQVNEFQQPDFTVDPWYMCYICKIKVTWPDILQHVTSQDHRLLYMMKNYQYIYKLATGYDPEKKSVAEYAMQIQNTEGAMKKTISVFLELKTDEEALKCSDNS
ncbi:hypothetical protein MAR_013494 [Mya arenaria]|uniref:Uncharacterized protein n=1 Tax=Mya arenaria TaxID=6604 RepID=A0ABY7G001_MYAAR|nr:hypothetical protein MAR_013494 [Mya arenaria]